MSSFVRRSSLTVALIALLAFASTASAKTFVVTKKGDPAPGQCKANDCSLREAVLAANQHSGSDTISLPSKSGAYKLSIAPAPASEENAAQDGDLDLTGKTSVVHSGKGRATIDANQVDRAFDVLPGARSSFKKLVITGGDAVGQMRTSQTRTLAARGGITAEGGGIRNASTITVRSSLIKKNRSLRYGGGIGVVDGAGLNLIDSTVTKNTAPSDGGGIDGDNGKTVIRRSKITANTSNGNGGGFYFFSGGKSQIVDSTFAGNRATNGDGGALRISSSNTVTDLRVSGSTFSGNSASGSGGAILVNSGALQLTNSTISGNSAGGGGGGGISAVANMVRGGSSPVKVKLNAVTVVGNKAAAAQPIIQLLGGGLQNLGADSAFKVTNSLIALNFSGTIRNDCSGTFASLGHNLLGTASSCGFDASGDRVKANPKVGKLKRNGGPTKTIALKKGSPAINKASKQSSPKRDQRGHKRGDKSDIGAYER